VQLSFNFFVPVFVPADFVCIEVFGEKVWRAFYTEDLYVVGLDFWNCEYIDFFEVL
jgi:hypothetical protein